MARSAHEARSANRAVASLECYPYWRRGRGLDAATRQRPEITQVHRASFVKAQSNGNHDPVLSVESRPVVRQPKHPPDWSLRCDPRRKLSRPSLPGVGRADTSGPVHFEFHHRTARRVFVAGSFNGWNPSATPLANLGGGRWLRLLWLPPGQHEYLFVVDGVWCFDPHAADYVPNVYGTMNATVEVFPPSELLEDGRHRKLLRGSKRNVGDGLRVKTGRLTLASQNHRPR